jgi:hypothetical protein
MSSRRKFLQHLSSTALLVCSGNVSKLLAEENYEKIIIPSLVAGISLSTYPNASVG